MNKNTKTHSLELGPPKCQPQLLSEELETGRAQEVGEKKALVEKEHSSIQGWVQDLAKK